MPPAEKANASKSRLALYAAELIFDLLM